MPDFHIKNVVVEKEAYAYALTHGVLERLPGISIQQLNITDSGRPSHESNTNTVSYTHLTLPTILLV